MKRATFLTISLLASTLVGCVTYHSGAINSNGQMNMVHEDIAIGVAEVKRPFGLGGGRKDALVYEAKRNLVSSRPLNDDEVYGTFTIDTKRTFFPFGNTTKITVTADVLRTRTSNDTLLYSQKYLQKLNPSSLSNNLFHVGDSVLVDNESIEKGIIQSFEGKDLDRVRISYFDPNGNLKTKRYLLSDVFFKVDDSETSKLDIELNNKYQAKVIGIGIDQYLIEDSYGRHIVPK